MKKIINKNTVLGLIVGIIISGVSVYAVETKYNAEQVEYKETTVKDALDYLYSKNNDNIIFLTSSWKAGSNWNNYGFSGALIIDNDYVVYDENNGKAFVTIKKDCSIKVKGYMKNTDASSSSPQYKLYHNNQAVLTFSNGKGDNSTSTNEVILDLKENDTLYLSMYGGGKPTYYITWFELQ